MTNDGAISLGKKLSPMLNGGFFRPLSRPTAAVYIDCAERLVESADQGGQIPYDEARLLIREVLVQHPDVQLDEDEGGAFRDLNQRAGQFFNKLLEVHWIQPRRVSLDENFVLIAPPLRRVLRLLRELAAGSPAELKDFASTLRSICRDLQSDQALDPNVLGPEEMRQTLKDLLERVGRAEDQMHAVESLILEHESAQRASLTAQETLHRFLVDFHAGEHMVCYDALQQSGLLPRIDKARTVALEALYNPFTKQRLAEGIATHRSIDETQAYTEAERWLLSLERQLASIPVKQRIIDGRMADFSRLSNARYRYQTEMRGKRPEQVKAYLEQAAQLHTGQSFSSLSDEPGMNLLSPVVEVFYGVDSLSRPRRQRPAIDLTIKAQPQDNDPQAAAEEIRRRNLHSLSPQRAARFVAKHLAQKGDKMTTEQLTIDDNEALLDFFSVLAFDRGSVDRSHHLIRWHVASERTQQWVDPQQIARDIKFGRAIERFTLERLS